MLRYLIFATLLAAAFAATRYDGYKVFRVTPKNTDELDSAFLLKESLRDYADFWKSPAKVGSPVDMLVSPDKQELVLSVLKGRKLSFETTVDDLQKDIDEERAGTQAVFDYEDYNTLTNINTWMADMAASYPSLVSVVSVGTSFEERDIKALKIGKSRLKAKDAVWYESGIHPREWISTATVIYMTKLLVEGYGTDSDCTDILDNLDVYMLPVYNVDGYEFTWASNGDRMWRKTRSTNTASPCMGTDPNRNWLYEWGGESNVKCSETYQGSSASSEIEITTVTNYIKGIGTVKAFIDFHAYGQMWMTPWGYTIDASGDYDEQNSLSSDATAALTAVSGTTYETGSIATTIYIATGSSADWAYGFQGIKHSIAVELRGNSFSISKINIKPSGIETFEALKVVSLRALET